MKVTYPYLFISGISLLASINSYAEVVKIEAYDRQTNQFKEHVIYTNESIPLLDTSWIVRNYPVFLDENSPRADVSISFDSTGYISIHDLQGNPIDNFKYENFTVVEFNGFKHYRFQKNNSIMYAMNTVEPIDPKDWTFTIGDRGRIIHMLHLDKNEDVL